MIELETLPGLMVLLAEKVEDGWPIWLALTDLLRCREARASEARALSLHIRRSSHAAGSHCPNDVERLHLRTRAGEACSLWGPSLTRQDASGLLSRRPLLSAHHAHHGPSAPISSLPGLYIDGRTRRLLNHAPRNPTNTLASGL